MTAPGTAGRQAGPVGACLVLRRFRAQAEVLVLGGCRDPGESVLASTRRALASVADVVDPDLWAVDLSGTWAVLAVDVPDDVEVRPGDRDTSGWVPAHEVGDLAGYAPSQVLERAAGVPRTSIGFRPMTRADFPDVVAWQARPHVSRWWSHEAVDVAGAERHYGPALDGDDPTRMWVLEVNGRSVGMVQDYLVGDHPDYALLTARPDSVGFDYLVGEPSLVGRGTGTRMLWTFLRDVVRSHYRDVTEYFAAPDHANAASLRVLDKLGFTRGLWFDEPQPDGRVDTVVGCTLAVRSVLG